MPKPRKCYALKPCGCAQHWQGTKVWTDRCKSHATLALPFGGVEPLHNKSHAPSDENVARQTSASVAQKASDVALRPSCANASGA